MIQIVWKKLWVPHELQGTDMSSTNKGAGTYNSKKVCCMNGKKDLEESLRRKTSLGKTCSLFHQKYSEKCRHIRVHSAILSALVKDSKFNCTPHCLSQDCTNSLI